MRWMEELKTDSDQRFFLPLEQPQLHLMYSVVLGIVAQETLLHDRYSLILCHLLAPISLTPSCTCLKDVIHR